ncbi:MAG: aldo/keto reductase [Christensenellaceae bacterium]|nr:aldo/keto reductase [Christensenellaceae bacterium]
MQYRKDKYGNDVSILGFGCMRFTRKGTEIDLAKAEAEILAAYHAGVNYYDTAYIYPGSEAAIGKIFERTGIRDSIYIATKLPHYMIRSIDQAEKIFQEELKRLRTDHVDYYLMHMLTDVKSWDRLKSLGILEWIDEKKRSGAIRQLGFSYHGNSDMFCQLVDAYDWDFCQIQYNYLDEHSQAGRKGLDHAAKKGLPVVIMEPLRGGRIVNNLPEKARKLFSEYETKRTPAAWAFRWLWDQEKVTCVLSGMNSLEMVTENTAEADSVRAGEFSDSDKALLASVVDAINEKMKVGCTGCGYCMPCPQKVDIPGTFSAYNKRYSDSKFIALKEYFMCTTLRKDSAAASNCIGCGKCERHCPQNLPIREKLADAKKELETPIFKIAKKIAPLFMKY